MRIYLSGAIEHAPDHGRRWRSELTPFLEALGHEVYDPAADEKKNLDTVEVQHFREWKRTDLERFQATVRKIIAYDLDRIEGGTDAIICHWDEHCSRGAGTQGELTVAHRMGMPVYLVTALPMEQISGWVLGCSTRIFSSMEELQAYFASNTAQGALGRPSATQESLAPEEVRSE